VQKDVLLTVVRGDEPIALSTVEPHHTTGGHTNLREVVSVCHNSGAH
jgi:hypothetical protein